MDGSFHAWLEERGPKGCLMDMVDDATNRRWAQLGEKKRSGRRPLRCGMDRALRGAAGAVRGLEELLHAASHAQERMRGEEPMTQFGRMCAKLGIGIIAASSPQAKGRVERAHGTHQDRLVKKLRRKEIANHEAANAYLGASTWRNTTGVCTRRRRGRKIITGARRARGTGRIFRLEKERTVSEDWVVRYDNRFFQLEPQSQSYAPTRSKVLVCEGRYGGLAIEYRGRPLRWREIDAPAKPQDSRYTGPQGAPAHADFSQETEVGAAGKPSVASSGPPRGAEARLQVGRHRVALDAGLALRFALNAPPCGLRRAALRTRPAKQRDAIGRARWESSFQEPPGANFFEENHLRKEKEAQHKKGDIFNEVRKGTFLKSFDKVA